MNAPQRSFRRFDSDLCLQFLVVFGSFARVAKLVDTGDLLSAMKSSMLAMRIGIPPTSLQIEFNSSWVNGTAGSIRMSTVGANPSVFCSANATILLSRRVLSG